MDEQNKLPGGTQKKVAYVLTALFLAVIFGFGIYGIASNPTAILNSVKYYKAKSYLDDPEDTSFFPMTSARIASLENRLGKNLPFDDELIILNASFQYALGKNMTVQGSEQMLRLSNGQIYNISQTESLAEQAEEIVDLYEALDGEIPFFFCYMHMGFFNGGLELPEGYAAIDTADEIAEELLEIIEAAGIETLDNRTFFEGMGLTNDDLEFKTDRHWNARATLIASSIFAEKINEMTGAELDLSKLDMDQFEETVYEDLLFSDYGIQVGRINADPDDVPIYVPTYETDITRHSIDEDGIVSDATGPFEESVIRQDTLIRGEDGTNAVAHSAYGITDGLDVLVNNSDDCEDITILVLRDSFAEPICSYLSLVAKNVVSSDLRYSDKTGMELIEEYDPDIVIVAFCRQMMERHLYDFGLEDS